MSSKPPAEPGAMSHVGGGGGQPTCTTVSLGKYVRRAFRAATGQKKKPKTRNKKPEDDPADSMCVSMERVSSFSAEAATAAAARKESVVRVVLRGGVVEVYPGVVLACTVIRKHPPGLCLAHPDVFRNPHGAVVRPLEPLFPGQKFLLLPESTVVRLKQRIPESSVGAFDASDASDDDEDSESEEDDGVAAAAASEEEEVDCGADSSVFVAGCSAREFYVANDRWAHCQFQKLVHDGLAVEQQQSPAKKKKKVKKKGNSRKQARKKRKDRRVAAPLAPGIGRAFAAPIRTWEPSLPSVEEEKDEACCSFAQDVATTPEIMLAQ